MSDMLKLVDRHSGDSDEFSYVLVDDLGQLQLHGSQATLKHDEEQPTHQPNALDNDQVHKECAAHKENFALIGPSGSLRSLTASNHIDHAEADEHDYRDTQPTSISQKEIFSSSLKVLHSAALSTNQQILEWRAACRRNKHATIEHLFALRSYESALVSQLGDDHPNLLAIATSMSQKEGDNATSEILRGFGAWIWDSKPCDQFENGGIIHSGRKQYAEARGS